MSYAFSGKLAGFRGFGDSASDYAAAVAAYNTDHAAWLNEKSAYDKAVQAFQGMSAGASSSYAAAQAGYNQQLIQWNALATARTAQVVAASKQQVANGKIISAANTAARAAGAVTPAGYPGCVSQAQHNAWQSTCDALRSVKGLGGDPTGPACALALLPVCLPAVAMPAALPPKPTPPLAPVMPSPPAPLRPEPQPPAQPAPAPTPAPQSSTPPVLNTGPQLIPSSTPTITSTTAPASASTPAPTKSGGLLSNGLLLVVLAGGGYALYRTFKKPKAAHA